MNRKRQPTYKAMVHEARLHLLMVASLDISIISWLGFTRGLTWRVHDFWPSINKLTLYLLMGALLCHRNAFLSFDNIYQGM
jgi:hypothetical protein